MFSKTVSAISLAISLANALPGSTATAKILGDVKSGRITLDAEKVNDANFTLRARGDTSSTDVGSKYV
jgi:hypothetical protein